MYKMSSLQLLLLLKEFVYFMRRTKENVRIFFPRLINSKISRQISVKSIFKTFEYQKKKKRLLVDTREESHYRTPGNV